LYFYLTDIGDWMTKTASSLSSVQIKARRYGECLSGSYKKVETWNGYF